jgi:predicted chitinase
MYPVYSPTFEFFVHARQYGQKNDLVEKMEAVAIDLQGVQFAMVDAQGFAEVVDIGDVAVRVADVARRINGGADGRKPVIIERT